MDIPWSRPTFDEREQAAAIDVIESGWLTQGEEVAAFEDDLGELTGREAAVVSNGTTALISALLAHDIGEGDTVLVPTYTFVATVNTVLSVGADPVLVDADPSTYNLDLADLEAKADADTDAVISVDVAGMPNDIDAITDICRDVGAVHIQDAAEAIGAEYDGTVVGGHDHTVTYSFHMAKLITSVEGGAVIGSDAICERVRRIRNHGMVERYKSTRFGLNFRMTDVQAAIGREQLAQLPDFLDHRAELAELYRVELPDAVSVQSIPDYVDRHPYMLFQTEYESQAARNRVDGHLQDAEIGTRICWRPVHRQPYLSHKGEGLDTADRLAKRSLALPIGNAITREEIRIVCAEVKAALS